MNNSKIPLMSVILQTPKTYETLKTVVSCLQMQTVKEKLELVIIGPSLKEMNIDKHDLTPFCKYQIIETGKLKELTEGRAIAIHAASAPLVSIMEDRWRYNGYRMVYVKDAIIYHFHRLNLSTFCKQHFDYGRYAYHYHKIRDQRKSGNFRGEMTFHMNVQNGLMHKLGEHICLRPKPNSNQ
jgi:hypothetical protein